MFKTIVGASVLLMFLAGSLWGAETARIDLFTPQGTVKAVRQVKVRFSEQMVSLGNPFVGDPFDIQCPAKGKGRWIDGKNWSYDFEKDLSAGVACSFVLKMTARTSAGKKVEGPGKFSFNTGGPAVVSSDPYEGDEMIDENQRFIFTLDGEPDLMSLAQHLYCSVEGIEERIGVRIVAGKEKSDFLKKIHRSVDTSNTVVFDCKRRFPSKAQVKIVWTKGIKSKSGAMVAKDQVLQYRTRPAFTASLNCMKESPKAGCMPLAPMHLNFSSPIPWATAREIVLKNDKGLAWRPGKIDYFTAVATRDGKGKAGADKDRKLPPMTVEMVTFEGPFPENAALTLSLPKGIRDEAGRPLSNEKKFPLAVKTHGYPPLAKFTDKFGIIELKAGGVLPVTVRNIEREVKAWAGMLGEATADGAGDESGRTGSLKPAGDVDSGVSGKIRRIGGASDEAIMGWLRTLKQTDRRKSVFTDRGQTKEIVLPRPGDLKEFEVLGIPLGDPGFYVVELESNLMGSRLLSKKGPMYMPTSALVTDMAAHFKWGVESSLIWVTSLEKGEPVGDAAVTLRDCTGKAIWEGRTDREGLARIDQALTKKGALARCPVKGEEGEKNEEYWQNSEGSSVLGGTDSGFFVFARKGADMTFTHSSWDRGIDPWRFNLSVDSEYSDKGDYVAHSVFDRTLFRAGETVSMKHFIRRKGLKQGLVLPPGDDLPENAVIVHVGGDQKYVFPLKWHPNGSAETTWTVPRNAKLGTYMVRLEKKTGKEDRDRRGWTAGSFQVEEFRVPLMKAVINGPKQPLIKEGHVDLDIALQYLAGGGASNVPVRLRSEVRPKGISFAGYESFTFSTGFVKKGLSKEQADESSGEFEDGAGISDERRSYGDKTVPLKTQDLFLDKTGAVRARVAGLPKIDGPKELVSELEFRDPNGEVQTVTSRVSMYPAKVHVGLSMDSEGLTADKLAYKVIALNLKGEPVAGAYVKASVFERRTYSHRRRIAGGFYAYESTFEIIDAGPGPHCQGKTDKNGLLFCEGRSPVVGEIVVEAQAKDDGGNIDATSRQERVYGKTDQWFEAGNDDRIDLIPEKRRYEPNETARFQVKMPFKEATVLVCVEREGVMDAYVRKVVRSAPFVEVPIDGGYAPNVYVSALAVRGRLGDTKPTSSFDGGKPAYKLGIAQIDVGWRTHELKVSVKPDRKTYKVRETVEAKIKVETALDGKAPKGGEVIVAAVDEGLLELKENESWKLLDAMMARRSYGVKTSTAQMMVVGKRHFGKKAMPQGGGGGRQSTRELFGTLLFWKATVPLDEKGEATVKIPLNDSLTSFRIVAVASGGTSLFGTGAATVATTQELMVFSGLPPVARETDRFVAGWTVRNSSEREMEIEAVMTVTGKGGKKEFGAARHRMAAGESRDLGWEVVIPAGEEHMTYELFVKDKKSGLSDTLKIGQAVLAAVPVRTFQATMDQLAAGTLGIPMEIPADALAGRGGVRVVLKPRITEGLSGVVRYMSAYPYGCFEQKTSKAVALGDEKSWKTLMEELPSYLDRDGLVRYFPSTSMQGSEVLTSYVLAIAHEGGYAIPPDAKTRMLNGLKGFVEGRIVRWSALPTADLAMRKMGALEALSRYGAARASHLGSVAVEPNLWPTSALLDWINVLVRMKDITEREKKLQEAQHILRSRMNLQGTVMSLSTEKNDYWWWLMASPDTNAVRTLLTILQLEGWSKDAPRIARGVVGRLKKGHWNTTVGNAWGTLAVNRFSGKFESASVGGVTALSFGGKTVDVDWTKSSHGGDALFPWLPKRSELKVEHKGPGRPWMVVESLAAIPLKAPVSTGYRVARKVTPVVQKVPGKWSKGDVARVRLEVDAASDMTWVAVHDPIPAGATILGGGLGRDSAMLVKSEVERGRAWEVFRERTFDALKVYYEYVGKGLFTVEYTMRLNNEGNFHLPGTRVEALYMPEMFGETPNAAMEIQP